ncbi:hypothetical protein B0J11DRAFT_583781 [Dendryphion nanum]|uniref:Uncharacterized protein n=1 Tax=Dendryphion nanum TaxID=256645 RepID=A0A9P9DCZ3_9PLEO|nr:hypothetical protein B0J11DRAFT_583781 [Dendryphion nanum]
MEERRPAKRVLADDSKEADPTKRVRWDTFHSPSWEKKPAPSAVSVPAMVPTPAAPEAAPAAKEEGGKEEEELEEGEIKEEEGEPIDPSRWWFGPKIPEADKDGLRALMRGLGNSSLVKQWITQSEFTNVVTNTKASIHKSWHPHPNHITVCLWKIRPNGQQVNVAGVHVLENGVETVRVGQYHREFHPDGSYRQFPWCP